MAAKGINSKSTGGVASNSGVAVKQRKLLRRRLKGLSNAYENGKLCVRSQNVEIFNGAAYPAYALDSLVLSGDEVEFPTIAEAVDPTNPLSPSASAKIMRVAMPAEFVDGKKYEDALIVTEDFSVYRYKPSSGKYKRFDEISLNCLPTIVPYITAKKDEYAVFFGGMVAAVRAGGVVKTYAPLCYKNFGCVAWDRIFFASSQRTLTYSAVLQPENQADSVDDGGYVVLDSHSEMRGLCAFKTRVYVFFEREVYEIDVRGSARNFVVKKLYYAGGKIYENSVMNCGNVVCFTTNEGIVTFDGTKFENVTSRRNEFVFSDLTSVFCTGASGKYLCGISKAFVPATNILYNTLNGAITEISTELDTVCAYGERLYVNDSGRVKEFSFSRKASAGISYAVQRKNEDFNCHGVKTLRKLILYGTGNVRIDVYFGAQAVPKTIFCTLSEQSKIIDVYESAETFSFEAFLSDGAVITGLGAEAYVF